MKSKRVKISVFSGVIVALALCIVGSEMGFSRSNMNSVLTRAEMVRTLGLCDCTHTIPRTSDCDGEECPGCDQASSEILLNCGSVTNGTGNSRDICDAESTPDGVCKEKSNVQCQRYQSCNEDGMPDETMKCNANGTCDNGTQWCVECIGGPAGLWEYKKTYECTWD